MKEKAIKKINKVGHIGFIISKIVKVFLIIGFVGALIGEIVLLWMPSNLFKVNIEGRFESIISKNAIVQMTRNNVTVKELDEEIGKQSTAFLQNGSLDIDDEEYLIGELYTDNDSIIGTGTTKAPKLITVPRIRGAAALAIVIMICTYVLLYFVGKLCKALETCETPFGEDVISSLNTFAYVLVGYVIVSGILGSIASELVANAGSVNIGINASSILVALAVYVLTVIFKYGAILQKESDETL